VVEYHSLEDSSDLLNDIKVRRVGWMKSHPVSHLILDFPTDVSIMRFGAVFNDVQVEESTDCIPEWNKSHPEHLIDVGLGYEPSLLAFRGREVEAKQRRVSTIPDLKAIVVAELGL
jgi:hypothetical protein